MPPRRAGFSRTPGNIGPSHCRRARRPQVSDRGKNFVLSLETGSPEAKASFFPLEEDQLDNDAPQSVTSAGTRIQITLKKSDQLQKPISVLKGVVVFSPDRAYEVAAPVSRH